MKKLVAVLLILVTIAMTGSVAMADKAKEKKASVKVVMVNKGELQYGDQVTLKAVVKNADEYELRWEIKEAGKKWKTTSETDATYTFTVTEQNAKTQFRVALTQK